MATVINNHSGCENFAPVDVAKGICRLTGDLIPVDSAVCPKFSAIPKCAGCVNFRNPDKDGIGTCVGLQQEYWTAGNYNADLCEGYVKNQ
jgi:4-hydroxyphenylacetate decarboxylase small subunit